MSNRKIETITKSILAALKTSIQDRIKIGKLLNEAREYYKKDDNKFGKWRSDNLSDHIDQKTANRYMRIAECFGDKLPDNIPLSGLYELSEPKNDDFRGAALESLTGKDKVTLKDVAAAIEQFKAPQCTELENVLAKVEEMSEKDSYELFKKIVEHISVTKVQDWLEMDVLDREAA